MTSGAAPSALLRERLRNQRLVATRSASPAEVVHRMGAVQAQDHAGALWAIAQRTPHATRADVEEAIAARSIVRTWPMRGTLHFVAADDIHWMVGLLAPRVIVRAAGRHRQLGLDQAAFDKSQKVLERALAGGRALPRPSVFQILDRAGIATTGQRGIHIAGVLAMRGALCFGPHGSATGRQPTFTLLEEWVPRSKVSAAARTWAQDRDEALGELARRYFASHGPATLHDFAWWTGLTLGEARRAVDVARKALAERVLPRGQVEVAMWSAPSAKTKATRSGAAHLLPAYDEYAVAYSDRVDLLDPAHAVRARNGIFSPVLLVAGRIAGMWVREVDRRRVTVVAEPFTPPDRATHAALEAATKRYGAFLGVPAKLDLRATRKRR